MTSDVPQLQCDLSIVVPVQSLYCKVNTDRQFVIWSKIAFTISLYKTGLAHGIISNYNHLFIINIYFYKIILNFVNVINY